MKVLIAEDDVISCRVLEDKLASWGYDVLSARDGAEAWEMLLEDADRPKKPGEESIRVAVIDWEMPRMDGVELCRKIRSTSLSKEKSYIYVILLTGRNHQDDIITGLSAGADDYITKPYNHMELEVRLLNGQRIIQLEDSRIETANTDSLTRLWNRNKILEFLDEELERGRREAAPTGVIWVDIDFFKSVNDTHGHITGDQVIIEVAFRLKSSMRNYDKIGRIGGDEFLVVIPGCNRNNVREIGERLRNLISQQPIRTDSGELRVSVSVGGTSSEFNPAASGKTLIQTSDHALYQAKREGRDRSVYRNPQPESE
jgi:diguanylate cyclase (GGDEF)-like protein